MAIHSAGGSVVRLGDRLRHWRQSSIWFVARALLLCVLLFGVALVYARVQGGFGPYFILYATSALLAFSVGAAVVGLFGVQVTRSFDAPRYFANEPVHLSVRIQARRGWPHFGWQVAEQWPQGLDQHVRHQRWVVMGPQGATWEATLENVPRGVYVFSRLVLRSDDLFGLVTLQRRFRAPGQLIVYPRLVPIFEGPLSSQLSFGLRPGGRYQEDVSRLSSVRPYQPGDRINRIHWKLTAKAGTPQSKEFEHGSDERLWLVIDRKQERYQKMPQALFEQVVSWGASLLWQWEQHGGQGFLVIEDRAHPMGAPQGRVDPLLDRLAAIQPNASRGAGEEIAAFAPILTAQDRVVVVSSRVGEFDLSRSLMPLLARRVRVVLHLFDAGGGKYRVPLEFSGSNATTWPTAVGRGNGLHA